MLKNLVPTDIRKANGFAQLISDNGAANPKAKKEFESILSELTPKVLYGAYGSDNQLKEIPFVEL